MESSVRINKLTILLTWRPPLFFPSGEINGLNNFNYLSQCPLVLDQTASLNKHSSHQGGKFTNFLTRFIPLPHPFGSPVKGCPCFLAFQSGLAQSSLSNFILSMEKNFHYVLGADAFLWTARPVCQFLLVLNFIQKCKKLRIARRSWKWTKLVDSCWKTSVIKTVWYWHKDKHWDRWNDLRIHK